VVVPTGSSQGASTPTPATSRLTVSAAVRTSSSAIGDEALAWSESGCAQLARKEYAAAAASFSRAIALLPAWFEAKHNLAQATFALGLVDEAIDLFREAAAGPRDELPLSAIATMIPGSASSDHLAVLEARRSWAERFLPAPRKRRAPASLRNGSRGRPLRVGYLSAFFRYDNWMKPLWALINHHDRGRFEIHLFSDAPQAAIPATYRPHPNDRFHDISGIGNDAVADSIEAAEIDILVDLNGYSAVGRLPVVARKPAPVVVALFNMYATSGIAAYDYLIGDAEVIDAHEERWYTETIVRVPGSYLTFSVDYAVPPVVAPPCLRNGAIAFGSLAPQYKITPAVLDAWCRILAAVPASTMTLRNTALGPAETREFVLSSFEQRGIDRERVRLHGPIAHERFLATYDEIDISLDTFPYNGSTTTMEAMWQGVPVVTFRGDRWAARQSASLLRAGSLGRFVASDQAAYEELAIELASTPDIASELAALRSTMRERLMAAPVCDTAAFARTIEAHYAFVVERL
jgi:predicted O-linked N-acetylglucosamine transferase (SPINDLY family)